MDSVDKSKSCLVNMTKQNSLNISAGQKLIKLGHYLKALRTDLDMSLRKAASLASISPAHLCKMEKGDVFKSVGIDILIRLANIYGIPLSAILEEAELTREENKNLPELAQYLRSKYGLSPQAIRDIELTKEVVDKKYKNRRAVQLDPVRSFQQNLF